MDETTDTDQPGESFPQQTLAKPLRRVLGVLIEKSLTTPESYPLTLNALISGCNQKSNRSPLSSYDEGDVEQALEELRVQKLAAVVHTAGGRTERFRHLIRHAVRLSEAQIAILGELLLRGSQQMGELRSRASRMVSIPDQGQLREELSDLLQRGLIRASGPLERRGIDVDHNLYEPHESASFTAAQPVVEAAPRSQTSHPNHETPEQPGAAVVEIEGVLASQRDLENEMDRLKNRVSELEAQIDDLKQQLGV